MINNRIITISRQYGSGGREIGLRLAKRLDLPFYDRELIALAARQSGLAGDHFVRPEQTGSFFLRDFYGSVPFELPLGDKVYLAQYAAIRALASQGPCVIVGRGAGGALQDVVPLLNVFVYADMEIRKRRAIEEYGDPAHKIEEFIESIDKKRSSYFRFYAGINGKQMDNYHLCVNSGFIGIDAAVTLIETAYLLNIENRQRQDEYSKQAAGE